MKNDFKYNLAFTAIVKDEAQYIEEWILFHQLVGVEKFYIYDNGSTDNLYEVLEKYIDSNLVEYKKFYGKNMQTLAYTHSVFCHKNDVKYMGFIDIDEFVFTNENKNLFDTIDPILTKCNAPGIGINWRMYGSSGYDSKPDGLVLENYKYRALDNFDPNKHIKTICNPRSIWFFRNPHFPYYKKGYNIDENGNKIEGPFNYNISCDILRINHYFTKSKEEYLLKMDRGRADSFRKRDMSDFYRHDQNDIYDPILEEYVHIIKNKLQEDNSNKKILIYR